MEIEIDGKKYTFTDDLKGWDYLNAATPAMREGIKTNVRLASQASANPKLSYNDICEMPVGMFLNFLGKFGKANKIDDFLE